MATGAELAPNGMLSPLSLNDHLCALEPDWQVDKAGVVLESGTLGLQRSRDQESVCLTAGAWSSLELQYIPWF